MLTLTLPNEASVRVRINARIAQLSFQMDVAHATQRILRNWIGKKINKRLADQLNVEAAPAAAARGTRIFASVKKREWPLGELNYDLTWYQSGSGPEDRPIKLEMPTAVIPGPVTEDAVQKLYQHSVHPGAMARHHAALIAYRDHPTWIADAVQNYRKAVLALKDAADSAGPTEELCNPDGTPRADVSGSVIYPISQLFEAPFISNHSRD